MRPLPFVWPYALLFWSVHTWAFWPEFRIVRAARRAAGAQDAQSIQVITWGMWLAYFGAYPLAWLPRFQFRADRAGRFLYYCNLSSEERCRDMKGTLIVEER